MARVLLPLLLLGASYRGSTAQACDQQSDCAVSTYCDSGRSCYTCGHISPVTCDALEGDCCSADFLVQCPSNPAQCPPPPPPRPPSPPPAPRRCVDRGEQNLRLSSTETFGDLNGNYESLSGSVQAAATAESYVWEGATGNWVAQSIGVNGKCYDEGNPPCFWGGPQQSSSLLQETWMKVVYFAPSNRTFLFGGNVTADGSLEPASACTSSAGDDPGKLANIGALSLLYIFGGQVSETLTAGCVGAGGLWPIGARTTRVGRAEHAVYAVPWEETDPGPGREYATELVVDELEGGDSFIPVSFSAFEPRLGGGERPRVTSINAFYSDWDSSDTPIPGSTWDIPAVCFSAKANATSESWRESTGATAKSVEKMPWHWA